MSEQPSPYGQPYGAYAAPDVARSTAPDKRPGTVTAAGIVTVVFSAVTALAFVAVVIAFAAARGDMLDQLRGDPSFDDFDPSTIVDVGVVVGIVFALWCLAAVVLGVLVMKRSRVARIVLVVSAVLSAVVSLIGILSLVSLLTLIASIVVVVLLFTGGANDWFAHRDGASAPKAPPPPLASS